MGQIQEGLRTLQQEAPDVFSNMMGSAFAGGTNPATTTATGAPAAGTGSAATTEGTTAAGTTGQQPTLGNVELATLMASLLNVAPGSGAGGAPQTVSIDFYAPALPLISSHRLWFG